MSSVQNAPALLHRAVESSDLDQAERCTLFNNVSRETLERLRDFSNVVMLDAGQTLMQGPENDRFYLILRGKVQLNLNDRERSCDLTLTAGECVGELSLIGEQQTPVRVIAMTDAQLMEIEQTVLWSLVHGSHGVARNLLHILSSRTQKDNAAISDSVLQQLHLEQMANVDGLTGIYNRRWLDVAFPRMFDRARFSGAPFALMIADIDHFKRCNDEYGHLVGDRILCHVARILCENLRPTDLLGRYGGEEFMVLLANTTVSKAMLVAERICSAVAASEPGAGGSTLPTVTISAGVAGIEPDDTADDLIERADAALFRAKSEGRNRAAGRS
ncbi:MAG TPA: GGDEF domain-containing protein [Gammaproteobacteria bacterium]|jgi:diguanylate cyclase (GGDEF)-like protein